MTATSAVPDMRLELIQSRYQMSTGPRSSMSRPGSAISTTPKSRQRCGLCN